MSTVLITGTSGFVGKALAEKLAGEHEVICMSRKNPGANFRWIRGDFSSFEDLRQLDKKQFDVVVHLAAVTGGCLERDGMLVNVEGTRCLMRYLIDRGCHKFVLASSIAVVGIQNPKFRPLQVPISDEHPCLDRDGYGFSKFMMEEVTKYYHRQNPQIDVINLRLAALSPDEKMPAKVEAGPLGHWALGMITQMALSDAVNVFSLAAKAPHKNGVRIMNATSTQSWTKVPVAQVLRSWWGGDVDLNHFDQPGHEYDSVYDVSKIKTELGFVAQKTK